MGHEKQWIFAFLREFNTFLPGMDGKEKRGSCWLPLSQCVEKVQKALFRERLMNVFRGEAAYSAVSRTPQAPQKALPWALAVPHCGQKTSAPLRLLRMAGGFWGCVP